MTTPAPQSAHPRRPAPVDDSRLYRAERRKKIFVGLSMGLIIVLILAITSFVDSRPAEKAPAALPPASIVGFWTSFCPSHNTIAADADAINIQKGEDPAEYLERLNTSLERQAADFRDSALILNTSSVMMKGSEQQKRSLQNLIAVMREGDKVFTQRAKELRAHPISTQAELDELAATLKSVYQRYSQAVSKAVTTIGTGDGETRTRVENLSECKQLFVNQKAAAQ